MKYKIIYKYKYKVIMLIEDYNTNKMVNRTNQIYNNMVNKLKQREEDIENELQVKSRLIEINNEVAREKNSKIMTITGSFIAFSVGVFAWVGFLGGKIIKILYLNYCFGICLFFVMATFIK